MAKPWGRIELDYINHDKFRAINATAICLWHEGKNYCDLRLTDGLIPRATATRFRFFSKTAVVMLTTSAGPKPGTNEMYAPLWEEIDGFGWKMHDYLNHNDCRERVQARLARYEEEKNRKRANQKAWRDRMRNEHVTGSVTGNVTGNVTARETENPITPPVTRDTFSPSLPGKHQQQHKQNTETEKNREPPPPDARSKRPVFAGQKFCVFEWQLDDLVGILGNHTEAFDLHEWFFALDALAVRSNWVIPRRDGGAWLRGELVKEAKTRGIPLVVVGEEAGDVWSQLSSKPSVRP